DFFLENLVRQRFREFDSAGAAKVSARSVAHISPALQKNAARSERRDVMFGDFLYRKIFVHDVDAALKSNEVAPRLGGFPCHRRESLCALARSAHQLAARRRGMADTALNLNTDNFEVDITFGGYEQGRETLQGFN